MISTKAQRTSVKVEYCKYFSTDLSKRLSGQSCGMPGEFLWTFNQGDYWYPICRDHDRVMQDTIEFDEA